MKLLILALFVLGLLLGAAALAVVWLTRWLAGRAAESLSAAELDTGLAIPMRDSDTRRTSGLREPALEAVLKNSPPVGHRAQRKPRLLA